jgi:hypothetical protein
MCLITSQRHARISFLIQKFRLTPHIGAATNEAQERIGVELASLIIDHFGADKRELDSIFDEYEAVRKSTIALFNGLPEDAFDRMGHGTGSANDATVRALAYHIAGHELHHYNIIKERYLKV